MVQVGRSSLSVGKCLSVANGQKICLVYTIVGRFSTFDRNSCSGSHFFLQFYAPSRGKGLIFVNRAVLRHRTSHLFSQGSLPRF